MPSELPPTDEERYEAFLAMFLRHRDRLFSHIFSLVPHEADAEDIFQRCSIVLWKKFGEFEPEGSFLAWSYGVATHEVRNFSRTRRRSRLFFFPEAMEQLTEERLKNEEKLSARRLALEGCLQRLSPREQQLLKIVYWEKQTLKQFADETNSSIQVLYNRLSKVRRALLACIERKVSGELRRG